LHKRDLEIARELRNERGVANALGELGNALVALGKVAEGRGYHLEQVQLAETLSQPREIANALVNLAVSLIRSGESGGAPELLERAFNLFQTIGNSAAEVEANQRLASAFEWIGDRRSAADRITIALTIVRKHKLPGSRKLQRQLKETLVRLE
jgi:hypothetical protein